MDYDMKPSSIYWVIISTHLMLWQGSNQILIFTIFKRNYGITNCRPVELYMRHSLLLLVPQIISQDFLVQAMLPEGFPFHQFKFYYDILATNDLAI